MAILRTPLLLLLLITLTLCAQKNQDISIDIRSGSQTPSPTEDDSVAVDINHNSNAYKSVWGTSLLNLAVPGTGHFYLGDTRKGVAYLSADLLLWTGFFFSMVTSNRYEDNAVAHAYTYAHTRSNFDYNNSYWGALGNDNFQSNTEYNTALDNNRQFDDKYLGDNAWLWDNATKQTEYNDIRGDAHSWETASYIVLGALFLNRVVSFIDGRVSAQRYNSAQMKIMPTYSMDYDNNPTFGAIFRMSF